MRRVVPLGRLPGGEHRVRESAVQFRILGPLEVWVDGRTVPIGGPKQRALLGILLLCANRVVSVDRLIEALWDELPVGTATAQVQSRVSTLRRLLDRVDRSGTSRDLVVTRAPGYVMRLTPDQLDLTVFEERVARARSSAAEGRLDAAADLFRDALGLWRGDVLSDIATPVVRAEATLQENRRQAVVEERIEADIGLGRFAEVVPELEAL